MRTSLCTKRAHVAALLTGILVLAATAPRAADLYVAPDGTPTGDGSQAQPLDLATAISAQSPARPGDTIYLRGGRYDGPTKTQPGKDGKPAVVVRTAFRPKLSGTEAAPTTITSAPGEWAHLNGAIHVQGVNYVHFVRLEVGDLDWDRFQEKHRVPTAFNVHQSTGLKIINCNIFGGAMGTGLWTPAKNLEVYGNLVHDFGSMARTGGRGHGHAFYMQNDAGTKLIERNIAYRSCGWLYDIYTQQGKVNGFDIIENIGFLGGHYKEGQTSFSFGLTGWQPSERIRFIGNVGYQPRDGQQWRSNMRLITHYKKEVVHDDAVVKDNYIMGAYRALSLSRWESIEVTGNTFWATHFLTEISSGPSGSGIAENDVMPDLANYRVDGNTYYETAEPKPFVYGRHENATPDELRSFDEWRALGLDRTSTVLPTRNGKPTGIRVFVFNNKYEPGRGNVAVFNWDAKEAVAVDLATVLQPGRKYRVYNCLDIKQTLGQAEPVLRATYDGKPVSLPLRRTTESPDFDAFLVLPE